MVDAKAGEGSADRCRNGGGQGGGGDFVLILIPLLQLLHLPPGGSGLIGRSRIQGKRTKPLLTVQMQECVLFILHQMVDAEKSAEFIVRARMAGDCLQTRSPPSDTCRSM